MGRLILIRFVCIISVVLATGQVAAQVATTAPQVQNQTTSATGTDQAVGSAGTAQTTASAGVSAGAETTYTVAVSPIEGVKPFPVGSEWKQRLKAAGIPPSSLWVIKAGEPTEDEQRELMARRHYFMGWYHLEMGQAGRAIEEFTAALEFDPANPHILLDAARARLAVREVAEAHNLVDQVLEQQTTNVEALRLRAEAFLAGADAAQGDEKENLLDDAVKSLEEARKLQPRNLEVLRGLAKAYVQQQEVEKVISVYRDIVAVDPRDTYSLLILAQVLSRMDRPQEAIEYYEKVIQQRRGFIGGYIYLGQLYERLKRYGDALDIYKQGLLVEPRNVDMLRRFEELVRQIHGATNRQEVLAEYQKFVEEYPANTEVRRIYAERLEGEDKITDAIKQYEEILVYDPENVEALISLGKVYSQQKNYDKAADYLSQAVDINPEKLDLYDAIASTMLAQEDLDGAAAIYRKAIDANPKAEKLYINLAALLEEDEKTTEAITVMETAVEKVGEKPELLAVLGKFYRVTDQMAKAEETLKQAYKQEPGNLPLFGELLSLYLEEGNTTSAEEVTSTTVEVPGTTKDVVLSVAAEFYFNAGRSDKAMELYLAALQENPGKLDYLARLVGIANRQKLYNRSLTFVEEFGGKSKDQDKIEQLKAEIYLASGQHDKAITIYRGLLADNPLDLSFYQYMVDAYNEADQYEESLKVVEEAKDKFGNSDPEAILLMSGMVHYKNKKYDRAAKDFEELIEKSAGKSDDAHYFLGSVYLDQEKFEKAEEQFRKAIEINPNSANALNALGYMYADRGVKLDEAKELISQALDLNPTAPHILDSMGWVLFKDGDLKGAEEYVERAARHFEDAEIFSHLGEIYAKQGKSSLAREMFERVLELDPEREGIRSKLNKISANGPE